MKDLAKRIIDKWSRMVFGISTSYTKGQYIEEDEEDDERMVGRD